MNIKIKTQSSMITRLSIALMLVCCFFITINLITQFYDYNFTILNIIKRNWILLLIWGITQLLFLLAAILWISYSFVAKPLLSFIHNIQQLNLEDCAAPKKPLHAKVTDPIEITFLTNTFNFVLDKLAFTNNNLLTMQQRLLGIINAMPSVIIGVDETGKITDWNIQAIEITKLPIVEVKGKILTEIYPNYTEYWLLAKTAMLKNSMQRYTKHLREVAQENRYFDIVAYPVVNDNCKGAVIRIDDVTTQALLEDIMAQTEKMNSLGGLAAGIAHEINNPLGSIVQSGQNILRRLDPAFSKNLELAKQFNIDINAVYQYVQASHILDFIHGIRDAGQRASNIITNLLQFARTNNTRKAMCNINIIVEKAIELASVDYDAHKKTDFRHINIIRDYSNDLPTVYCSAMEMEQVFLNIFKNAAYALKMITRIPEIHIKIHVEKDMLIIEIQDNGPGMKDEVKRKIFDPFFTTKPVGEGTGLGLSVSFNIIVERHSGSLAVESTEGVGTKFIIVLPLIIPEMNVA